MWIFKVLRHGYLFKYPYNLMTMKNESYLCSFQRWCGKYGISQSGARGGLFIHPHMYLFPSCNAIKLLFLQDMKKQNALRQPMKPILFLFEEENCEFLSAPLKKARNLSEVERPKGYVRFSKTYLKLQYILGQYDLGQSLLVRHTVKSRAVACLGQQHLFRFSEGL